MPVWLIIFITAAVTYAVSVVVRQFLSREKKIQRRIEHLYSVEDDAFARSMGSLLPPDILDGNKVTPLINGDEIFPAMLGAIRAATKTITFETFIYWSGRIGREFAEALAERARSGVRVHVLLDWVGSKNIDPELLELIEDSGAEIQRYHPLRPYNIDRWNNRTHRKLLVVDGRIGFTGGVGIADEWTGDAQDPQHWRDSHFQVEGPSVAQLQAAFMDNWLKTQSSVLHGDDYFPPLDRVGNARCQVFQSSPAEGSESVRLMYLMSITAAARSIHLASAYFVPDNLSVATLVDAVRRSVKVQIILPGKRIDTQTVRRASRSRWGPLLEAGVEIYEYQPTMYHTKVMIVDELWISVGSTNFDSRSFRLNDEANLNILDRALAQDQVARFDEDLAKSRRITLDEWRNRPWTEKLWEHSLGLLRWQL